MNREESATIKLTMLQHNRLMELRNIDDRKTRNSASRNAGFCKATTAKLEAWGLVEIKHRHVAKTGRIMSHGDAYITALGREALDRYPLPARAQASPEQVKGEGR
jgi:hypothetical protein